MEPTAARWSITGMCFWLSLPTYSAPRRCGKLKSTWMVPHCQSRPRLSLSVNSRLTPMASVAALGHRKMQAFFCDTRFAHFSGRRRRLRPGSARSQDLQALWLRRERLPPCPRFRRNPRALDACGVCATPQQRKQTILFSLRSACKLFRAGREIKRRSPHYRVGRAILQGLPCASAVRPRRSCNQASLR